MRATTLLATLLLPSILIATSPACGRSSRHAPSAAADAAPAAPPAPPAAPAAPALRGPKTTAGRIALGNLDAQIEAIERELVADPAPAASSRVPALVPLLLVRARTTGRVADLDRALALAEAYAGAVAPAERPGALLLRSDVLATLHRFTEAEELLARAAKLGAPEAAVAARRAGLAAGLGRYDEALAARRAAAEATPDTDSLGALGALEAELGRTADAEAHFAAAVAAHRGTSPFALAWLSFAEGQMWEHAGDTARARAHYEAAIARVPGYAHATVHLAALEAQAGDRARAIALVTPLADGDDPEPLGLLAAWHRAEGRQAEADALVARARAGFDALTARHPAAFADHAARFWLAEGKDPAKAHSLAQTNLAARRTPAAYQLAMEAALAAHQDAAACAAADGGTAHPHAGPALLAVAYRAYTACARPDDAARVDARLAPPGPSPSPPTPARP